MPDEGDKIEKGENMSTENKDKQEGVSSQGEQEIKPKLESVSEKAMRGSVRPQEETQEKKPAKGGVIIRLPAEEEKKEEVKVSPQPSFSKEDLTEVVNQVLQAQEEAGKKPSVVEKFKEEAESRALDEAVKGAGKVGALVGAEVVGEVIGEKVVEEERERKGFFPRLRDRFRGVSERGKPTEIVPKEIPVNPPEEVREVKEKKVKGPTFENYFDRLTKYDRIEQKFILDKDSKEFKETRNKMDEMVTEAERAGAINLESLEQLVLSKISNLEWDEIDPELTNMAFNTEREFEGDERYQPRWKGMAKRAIEMVNKEIITRGKSERSMSPGYGEWLKNTFNQSPDTVKKDLEVVERGKIIDLEEVNVVEKVAAGLRSKRRHDKEALGPMYDTGDLVGKFTDSLNKLDTTLKGMVDNQAATVEAISGLIGGYEETGVDMTRRYRRAAMEGGFSSGYERERWIDVGYRVDFASRFDPNLEPYFYTRLTMERNEEERHLWDDVWQIQRASFFKKVYTAFPEKYVDNQDLNTLTIEKTKNIIENVPGVHEMLIAYQDAYDGFVKLRLRDDNGVIIKDITWWDIETEGQREKFREALRKNYLGSNEFESKVFSKFPNIEAEEDEEKIRKLGIERKLADSLANDLLQIGLQPEFLDSRYSDSASGRIHPDIMGEIASDDYRTIIHPQEKFERKSLAGHEKWSKIADWGAYQVEEILKHLGLKREDVKVEFKPAEGKREFWKYHEGEPENGKRKIIIYSPELYPVTMAKSFFNIAKEDNKTSLTEHLRGGRSDDWQENPVILEENVDTQAINKISQRISASNVKEIKWGEIGNNSWAIWNTTHFKNAVELMKYYKEGVPYKRGEPLMAQIWAAPFNEFFYNRLHIDEILDEFDNPETNEKEIEIYQKLHNLKITPLLATFGIEDIRSRVPQISLSGFGIGNERGSLREALSYRNVGYLKGENLEIQ